ncbi:MAG TPA: hypothetical protein VGF55_03795 [Gemmataceae bacterium]|jgi:hypothetical protein
MKAVARRSVVLALIFLAGCAQPGMAPVKGRVMFKGRPVPDAAVTFNPVPQTQGALESGKPGTGWTNAEGQFTLSTYKPYDGAFVGQHRVAVSLDDTNPVKCKRTKSVVLEVTPGGNEFDIEMDP